MQSMVPLYGFGGGSGGTGATLNVTAPAGCTVTVSKEGKTQIKIADSSGSAVFKGLATGEWTLSIDNGDQTRTQSVLITADYSAVIAFFAATIHITYPEGSACTASDGSRTLSAPDTGGAWACVVPNTGTWTITITDGDKSVSKSVEITAEGQIENLRIAYFSAAIHVTYPEGSTCTATDGVTTLTAPDTSGTWECVVPNAGTWTVSCTDGTRNKQIEIAISEDGQSESAVLQYALYLYKTGDGCTDVTGGWRANNANEIFTLGSEYISMSFSGGSNRWGNILTINKVNLAEYSTLNIDVEITSNGELLWYGVSLDAVTDAKSRPSNVLANGNTGGTMARGVLSLDVSSIETSGYVCVSAYVVAGKIYNVWLS